MKIPLWPTPLGFKPIDLNLSRMNLLLRKFGNILGMLPPIIHVAGTNGKGSTIALLKAIFEESGYKVHAYISPHLINFNERITLAGTEISDEFLSEILEEIKKQADIMKLPLTFFEATTFAAFIAFSRVYADILLLEVGLGGRLDATNIIKKPKATIITPISYDHTDYLGNTLEKIAYEKAGIIKSQVPCISSLQDASAAKTIQNVANNLNAPLLQFNKDFSFKENIESFTYSSKNKEITLPKPNLIGAHQLINATTVIAALSQLKSFNISDDALKRGLLNVKWPARLERLHQGKFIDMVPKNWELWLDGAHNEAGSIILSNWAKTKTDMPLYLIVGMTKGRESNNFLYHFSNIASFVCAVKIESEPSCIDTTQITNSAIKFGIQATACNNLSEAVRNLAKLANGTPARILICGSLYLAGDVISQNSIA